MTVACVAHVLLLFCCAAKADELAASTATCSLPDGIADDGAHALELLQKTMEVDSQTMEVGLGPYSILKGIQASPGHPTWGFSHMPKCGGVSFLKQLVKGAVRLLPEGDGVEDAEVCHAKIEWQFKQKKVATGDQHYATFFREPRAQVYSQYLHMVAHNVKGWTKQNPDLNEVYGNVTTWLTHFAENRSTTFQEQSYAGEKKRTKLPGYNPVNMQSRFFECIDPNLQVDLAVSVPKDEPLPMGALKDRMEGYTFIGILERYQESICLFAFLSSDWRVMGKKSLPTYCDCQNKELWESFSGQHEDHGVRSHSVNDLSSHDLKMVDAISQRDAMLWRSAVKRFTSDIDKAERTTGTKILCDRQIVPGYMASASLLE